MKFKKYLLGVIVLIAFVAMGDISDTDTYMECNSVSARVKHRIVVEVKSKSIGAVTDAGVKIHVVHRKFKEGESECVGHMETDYSGTIEGGVTDNDGFYKYEDLNSFDYDYDLDETSITVTVNGGYEVGYATLTEERTNKYDDKDFYVYFLYE